MSLEPGARFADRYEIVRRLGTGGMGTVYLARHLHMDRPSAIKVLGPEASRDPEALERFTREARNASRISHPNVCAVYDFGTTPAGMVYLAMEYVEGRSLGALLLEQGRLAPHRAAALLAEIAAGLDAAHDLGIVHRDLKPDNVMVTTVRDRETVKLVDFGIAKALEQDLQRDVTAPGVVVGTPDYMAPEQFAGDPADRRSDLYSLGLIFYRMVTGVLPFQGTTARETLTQRLTEPPLPLAVAAPDAPLPGALQDVMDRVLARRPEARYPTATAFSQAVQAALAGTAGEAAGSQPTVRLDAATTKVATELPPTRRVRTRRRVLPVALAAGTIGVAYVAYRAWAPPAPTVTPPPAPSVTATPPRDTTAPGGATKRPAGDSAAGRTGTPTRPATPPSQQAGPTAAGADTLRAPTPRQEELPEEIPALPTPEEVMAPETQDAARARAAQIYRRADAELVVRAQAAFIVATVYGQQNRYAEAELWATRAIAVNDSLPASSARDRRADRYRGFLSQVRLKPEDPSDP